LLRADFFDSDSFFENEMESKLEQSWSAHRRSDLIAVMRLAASAPSSPRANA
jgi:hypothetical protein